MSRLNELSEREIRILADAACNERLMGIEFCDALKRVLEEALTLDTEPQPKFKVGDKVVVTSGNNDFVPYVGKIARLDKDSAQITVGCGLINVPIDRLMPYTEPTAEDSEENEESTPSRLADAESPYSMMAIFREEEEKRREKNYRMELAAKIAIAYAEKGRYEPWEIGAKAVEVANGVVEQLKNNKRW